MKKFKIDKRLGTIENIEKWENAVDGLVRNGEIGDVRRQFVALLACKLGIEVGSCNFKSKLEVVISNRSCNFKSKLEVVISNRSWKL
jgi:hypothetical protein